MNQEKQDLKNMSIKELRERVDGCRRNLFALRLNATTAHVKDYSQFKKMRKSLARALTSLYQKVYKEFAAQVSLDKSVADKPAVDTKDEVETK